MPARPRGGKGQSKNKDSPMERARGFREAWEAASDSHKKIIMEQMFMYDLKTIALEKPVLDPKINGTEEVKMLYKNVPGDGSVLSARENAKQKLNLEKKLRGGARAAKPAVVDLLGSLSDDDDNDADTAYRNNPRRGMQYHAITESPGKWPGPLVGLRFNLEMFRFHLGLGNLLNDVASSSVATSALNLYDQAGPLDMDDLTWWYETRRRGGPSLIKGFPLVEEITFVRHTNLWDRSRGELEISDGMCYWTTTAMLIYGNPWHWLRVKAEHRAHFESVLSNPKHPKYALFRELNEKWYETPAIGPTSSVTVMVNLWQILSLPFLFTPAAMADVTADLYNVYIVMFCYGGNAHGNKVYETRLRGAYNSRHLFYLFAVSAYLYAGPGPYASSILIVAMSRMKTTSSL